LKDPTSGSADRVPPWIEVINDGSTALDLSDYLVTTGEDSWRLPVAYLEPHGLYILQSLENIEHSGAEFLSEGTSEVSVVSKSDQLVVDSVTLVGLETNESFARYPNGTGGFFVYPPSKVTFGELNPDIGFISKLASTTAFSPRDSSPNAILWYGGFFWILGGWGNFGGESWHSFSDVWRSTDGLGWELVSLTPPYIHYCSFVVWKDRMWAIGPSSFSSTDGLHWRPEAIQSPELNRSVVFNDMLVNIHGATVMATRDGTSWTTMTDTAPWGILREKPAVVVYRDKIWVIGGVSDYGTPNEMLHNDVWASRDGISWELINRDSRWAPRIWASAVVYDNKIFLFNGANRNLWPGEYGNSSEIWWTDDGVDWFELKSETIWGARHASFSVVDPQGGVLLLAGYGHGGTSRLYNDVWTLRASFFFSKPDGDLHELGTWGKNRDGSGPSPASFRDSNQMFVLRNRTTFTGDERWSVSGAGSRILVGDGDNESYVHLEISNESQVAQPMYLYSNSTTVVRGHPPAVLFKDPGAALVFQ
jgi:hypothetical protein